MASLNYYRMFWNYIKLLVKKDKTLGGTADEMAARRGGATFLYFEDEKISFAEFNRLANRRANLFHEHGVGKGEVVALMMENRPEYLTTLVGLSKLGAISAGINTNLTGAALIHSFKTAQGKKAIIGTECLPAFKEAMAQEQCLPPEEVYLDTRWEADTMPLSGSRNLNELLAQASEESPPGVSLSSGDLFMYIYTSGTTGMPKAARINHLRWYGAGLAFGWYAWGVRETDIIYCPLPLYHSNGALLAFGAALRNGAALALARRFSASSFWRDVRGYGATCFIYIGEVLRYLLNRPPEPTDKDHAVTRILGNGLRPDIWDAFKERFGIAHIREFYASTEGNAYTFNLDNVPGSVGKSLIKPSNLHLVKYDVENEEYIRGEKGFCQPCEPGELGELLGKIKGTTPFSGYTSDEESEKKLLRNVFKKGDVFFKTGDLLKTDEAGNYYFIDRIGDTFRWKGENVSTHEVAEIISTFPGVEIVTVYGVQVPGTDGRAGMAAVNMEAGTNFDSNAFYQFTAIALPSYAQPAFVRIRPELEVTGTFKLIKTGLKIAGYDPGQVSDPLFFRDSEKQSYVPVDQALYGKIRSGSVRI
ncbi:MAG: long-chain-acyl-CoA synthetase [SAR324 cluster bacterium]|nr:long-chain-acyl-CoA synthetase [SAR324 cluster bacterium]